MADDRPRHVFLALEPRLRRLASAIARRRRVDADDLFQDAVIVWLRKLPELQPDTPEARLVAYFGGIANNIGLRHVSQRRDRASALEGLAAEQVSREPGEPDLRPARQRVEDLLHDYPGAGLTPRERLAVLAWHTPSVVVRADLDAAHGLGWIPGGPAAAWDRYRAWLADPDDRADLAGILLESSSPGTLRAAVHRGLRKIRDAAARR